jgi:putative transposase
MMILTYADYQEAIEYLNAHDRQNWRHPHRLPLERYSWSDCEYFFTICARHSGTPFTDPALAEAIIDSLLWRKERHGWFLFCYCLMPDHLHFIAQLPDEIRRLRKGGARGDTLEGILDQVGDFKSFTTSQIWWKIGGKEYLWQQSSYDRVIRYGDSVDHAVSYVLNNAVRKHIVDEWTQYPYAKIVDQW